VKSEMSTPRETQVGVHQVSVLSRTLYSIYIINAPKHLVFTTSLCRRLSVCDRSQEGFSLRNLQRGLNSMETCCEHWNIKSTKKRLVGFNSLVDVDRPGPLVH
jgi:hypothetical protein